MHFFSCLSSYNEEWPPIANEIIVENVTAFKSLRSRHLHLRARKHPFYRRVGPCILMVSGIIPVPIVNELERKATGFCKDIGV